VVLGSFRLPHNAQRVQRDHGDIKPVVQKVTVNNKRYYRVVAGPYTASRAADIRDGLKAKSHIDAIVARDCDATGSKRHCIEIDG
jgi:cell division protein FtsN